MITFYKRKFRKRRLINLSGFFVRCVGTSLIFLFLLGCRDSNDAAETNDHAGAQQSSSSFREDREGNVRHRRPSHLSRSARRRIEPLLSQMDALPESELDARLTALSFEECDALLGEIQELFAEGNEDDGYRILKRILSNRNSAEKFSGSAFTFIRDPEERLRFVFSHMPDDLQKKVAVFTITKLEREDWKRLLSISQEIENADVKLRAMEAVFDPSSKDYNELPTLRRELVKVDDGPMKEKLVRYWNISLSEMGRHDSEFEPQDFRIRVEE